MFGVDNDKFIDKIKNEVLPDILQQDVEDIVKYNLVLAYLMKVNSYKEIALLSGATIGAACFFAVASPILAAVSATGAIASLIHVRRVFKDDALHAKLFHLLSIAIEMVYQATPAEIQDILDNTSAEDIVNFLERKGLTTNEE